MAFAGCYKLSGLFFGLCFLIGHGAGSYAHENPHLSDYTIVEISVSYPNSEEMVVTIPVMGTTETFK
jgi:hypothetical protein